jgi:nucleotide-binding universal stress UspA family protein
VSRPAPSPSHVLVALDGSPLSDAALEHALATFDCPTTVLSVVTPLDASMSEGGVIEPGEERREDARARAERLVEDARERAAAVDRTLETAVEAGTPAEAILEYVERNRVDHVVMGGHGGTDGIAGRLLGTVATEVVGEAPVSVTVVR